MEQNEIYSSIESNVLSFITKNNEASFDEIFDNMSISEKNLTSILGVLIAKKIIKLDIKTGKYKYLEKINGDILLLDGNLLLPTTILKFKDKILISRGKWYEFPIDFDIRRIVWNIEISSDKQKSSLADIIKSSVVKERKSKLIQMEEYNHLRNCIVPYSDSINLKLNTIGETATDVTIQFKVFYGVEGDMKIEHKGFTVRTEISTEELISELSKSKEERNYTNINLPKLFEFKDFLFKDNEFITEINEKYIKYIKITKIRGNYELTSYVASFSGNKKLDVDLYEDTSEALSELSKIFKNIPFKILKDNNINMEE